MVDLLYTTRAKEPKYLPFLISKEIPPMVSSEFLGYLNLKSLIRYNVTTPFSVLTIKKRINGQLK